MATVGVVAGQVGKGEGCVRAHMRYNSRATRAYACAGRNLVVDVPAGGVVEFPHGAVCTGQNERET